MNMYELIRGDLLDYNRMYNIICTYNYVIIIVYQSICERINAKLRL